MPFQDLVNIANENKANAKEELVRQRTIQRRGAARLGRPPQILVGAEKDGPPRLGARQALWSR